MSELRCVVFAAVFHRGAADGRRLCRAILAGSRGEYPRLAAFARLGAGTGQVPIGLLARIYLTRDLVFLSPGSVGDRSDGSRDSFAAHPDGHRDRFDRRHVDTLAVAVDNSAISSRCDTGARSWNPTWLGMVASRRRVARGHSTVARVGPVAGLAAPRRQLADGSRHQRRRRARWHLLFASHRLHLWLGPGQGSPRPG